jgi:putative flippase GtrA
MIARQFLRFVAVGAAATSVHYVLLIALIEVLEVEPLAATLIGFAAGAVVGYSLNRRYTFDTRPAYASGLIKFLIVIGVGAAINTAIFSFFVRQGLHYMVAQVIATGLVLIWNYAGSRWVVFR